MTWDDVGISTESEYLEWQDKESIRLHLLTVDPYTVHQHFFRNVGRGANCPGAATCPACASGDRSYRKRPRHAFLVYSFREAGRDREGAKIWIMSDDTAKKLRNIWESYKTFDGIDLVVTRTGTGLETEYNAVPVPTQYQKEMLIARSIMPKLEDSLPIATPEDIQLMMAGKDPRNEFDPAKMERR